MNKEQIIDFLSGKGKDYMSRTYGTYLTFDAKELEKCHDYIQYMFPLHEHSNHSVNANYPIITPEVANEAGENLDIIQNIVTAYDMYKEFLGVGPYFDINKKWWRMPGRKDHNQLRITRIIRSLRLLGLDLLAKEFYDNVMDATGNGKDVSATTRSYWDKALNDDMWATLK